MQLLLLTQKAQPHTRTLFKGSVTHAVPANRFSRDLRLVLENWQDPAGMGIYAMSRIILHLDLLKRVCDHNSAVDNKTIVIQVPLATDSRTFY